MRTSRFAVFERSDAYASLSDGATAYPRAWFWPTKLSLCVALFASGAAASLLFVARPAAAEKAPPAADYVCAYGCRPTDANPRLEIEGKVARCWNELGGLYVGEFHPPDVVACFRKTGRLLDEGARIEWSDGVIWRRH